MCVRSSRRRTPKAYHLVNRLDDLEHLVVADLAIAVDIVELEGPVKLVLHLAAASNAESADELLEVNGAGFVAVENIEDVVREGRRVAEGEELAVNLLELLLGECAGGAVLQEALRNDESALPLYMRKARARRARPRAWRSQHTLVPLLQFLLVEMGRLLKLIQLLLRELGLSVGKGYSISLCRSTTRSDSMT